MPANDTQGVDLPRYNQRDFEGDKPPCDLIMKGGITSGVVYPFAITELARRYRFISIGGTSAGAIAAGIAAAAEYGRAEEGFLRLAEIPQDVSKRLLSLFQPEPRYRAAFRTFLSALGDRPGISKALTLIGAALLNHWWATLIGLIPGAVLVVHSIRGDAGWPVWAVTALLLALGPLLAVAGVALLTLLRGLPRTLFGICPGLRQPGNAAPALTDWLAETLERVAGRTDAGGARPSRPLTFGDLKARGIDLNVMSTNLSMRRPQRLPADMNGFFWRKADFEQLFPEWVLDYLTSLSAPQSLTGCPQAYPFPAMDDLPVIVAVRMSLSFPVLLAAVPLYTRDFTYRLSQEEQHKARVCWFSDGGISSNFPIHFFDNLWPSRPTFAISLDAHHPSRHGPKDRQENRVYMPSEAGQGLLIPVNTIGGVIPFLGAILGAAKDWQDIMQSVLSGYRERIAHIALTTEEGGLNLTMGKEKVRLLSRFGYLAGGQMHRFDFDEHRWRRYLVALARLEETLHGLTSSYESSYRDFLAEYAGRARSYQQPDGWIDEALINTDALMRIAAQTLDNPLHARGDIPKPETDIRITPRI
jgi:predicted acylesterase/phospholipase RssA